MRRSQCPPALAHEVGLEPTDAPRNVQRIARHRHDIAVGTENAEPLHQLDDRGGQLGGHQGGRPWRCFPRTVPPRSASHDRGTTAPQRHHQAAVRGSTARSGRPRHGPRGRRMRGRLRTGAAAARTISCCPRRCRPAGRRRRATTDCRSVIAGHAGGRSRWRVPRPSASRRCTRPLLFVQLAAAGLFDGGDKSPRPLRSALRPACRSLQVIEVGTQFGGGAPMGRRSFGNAIHCGPRQAPMQGSGGNKKGTPPPPNQNQVGR